MYRKINRFNWTAAIWIACGVLDILILSLVEYYTIVRNPYSRNRWIYECTISFSCIAAIGSIVSGFMLYARIWKRIAIPATCIFVWGFLHSMIAASYVNYYTIKIPRREMISVTIITLIGMTYMIASLFAVFSTRAYLHQRQKFLQSLLGGL